MRGLTLAVIALTGPFAAADEAKTEWKLTPGEQAILDMTNAERKTAGVKPLKPNRALFYAAIGHSRNMAAKQTIAHVLDGKNFDARVRDEGYKFGAGGENVAMGQRTPKEAMSAWMNSEGHRANILNPDYVEIGVGIARGADGQLYWTQVFAAPLHAVTAPQRDKD